MSGVFCESFSPAGFACEKVCGHGDDHAALLCLGDDLAIHWFNEEKRMRLYIAGPMTSIKDFNYPAFYAAAAAWRTQGWDVVNPAESFAGDTSRPYRDYVKKDLELLKSCDAIAVLPGWDGEGARGSVWETEVATSVLGMDAYVAENPVPPPHGVPAKPKPETILEEAQRLVHGDRGADYGRPIHDYTRTGRMWGAILGIPDIDPRIACLMMAAVKISREVNKHKADNLVDLAGYAECASMVAEDQAEP